MTQNIILDISGMMCMHCENRVKKVLNGIDGVEANKVSHEEGIAEIAVSGQIDDAVLTKAITDAGYTVNAIKR